MAYDDLTAFSQIRKLPDGFSRLKADDDIGGSFGDHRSVQSFAHADMAEHTASPLCHADGLGAHDGNVFFHGGGSDQLGSENRSLSADSA